MNYARVAKAITTSRRREVLSFSHHVEVAGLDDKSQIRWLERAERERLSVHALRGLIAKECFDRETTPLPPSDGEKIEGECSPTVPGDDEADDAELTADAARDHLPDDDDAPEGDGEGETPLVPRRPRGNPLLFDFSWAESDQEQRAKFLDAIGLTALVGAMSERMRNELLARVELQIEAERLRTQPQQHLAR
jgi:hypothetical protein